MDFEPLCHYPETVPLADLGDGASCFCRQDRSDDDASWIIQNAFTVLSMQAGFALLESGSVTDQNVVNIMIKNMSELGAGGALYFLFGYALIYGGREEDHSGFLAGGGNFALIGLTDHTNFLFSFSFAMSTATIISGAVAERIDFWAYLTLSCFYTNFVYPIGAYWTWGAKGFLGELGMLDYAGGGAVHIVGGTGAFVAAMWIGPRLDRFSENALRLEMHDPTSVMWGTFVLWLGWFGFTSGSSMGFSGGDGVGAVQVAINTAISGTFGLLSGLIYSYYANHGHVRVEAIATSLLSALVSITSGCSYVQPWEAAIIGFSGALVGTSSCKLLDAFSYRLQLDDPVQAIGVHFTSGIWGMLCTGLFAGVDYCHGADKLVGLFHGGGFKLLGLQLLGIVCMIAWSATSCLAALSLMHYLPWYNPIRISEDDERLGLDLVEHGVYNRKREMMERVGELSAVMRDLDLIDVPEEERNDAVEQLQTLIGRGDTTHRGAPSADDWHHEERTRAKQGGGEEGAAHGEGEGGEGQDQGPGAGAGASGEGGEPAGQQGIDGTERSSSSQPSTRSGPPRTEGRLDGTDHSGVSQNTSSSIGSDGERAGRWKLGGVKRQPKLRRIMTSRYSNAKVSESMAKARQKAADAPPTGEVMFGRGSGVGGGEHVELEGLPEDREWTGAERGGGRARRRSVEFGGRRWRGSVGVRGEEWGRSEEEWGRREEEWGRREEEWGRREEELRERWRGLEAEMTERERAIVALMREEVALLRERLAEAEGGRGRLSGAEPGAWKHAAAAPKQENGSSGVANGHGRRPGSESVGGKLGGRTLSLLALRMARDENRERLLRESEARMEGRRSSIDAHHLAQGPGSPVARGPGSPEVQGPDSPGARANGYRLRSEIMTMSDGAIQVSNAPERPNSMEGPLKPSPPPNQSPRASLVPIHVLRSLQAGDESTSSLPSDRSPIHGQHTEPAGSRLRGSAQLSQSEWAARRRAMDGAASPEEERERSGIEHNLSESDLLQLERRHRQQQPISQAEWAALRRTGSGSKHAASAISGGTFGLF